VICIIGPEGGFTEDEVEFCRQRGFIDVGLGPRTLRAETAAIVAAAVCQHLWGDLGRHRRRSEPLHAMKLLRHRSDRALGRNEGHDLRS
jgi:hypothetical protein